MCVPLVQRILCASGSLPAAKLWGSGAFFLPPQGMYYPVSTSSYFCSHNHSHYLNTSGTQRQHRPAYAAATVLPYFPTYYLYTETGKRLATPWRLLPTEFACLLSINSRCFLSGVSIPYCSLSAKQLLMAKKRL